MQQCCGLPYITADDTLRAAVESQDYEVIEVK